MIGSNWSRRCPASASHAVMRSRSPISPIPQLRVDGIEKSGTRIPARRLFNPDVIEGGVGNRDDDLIMTRARLTTNLSRQMSGHGQTHRQTDQAARSGSRR